MGIRFWHIFMGKGRKTSFRVPLSFRVPTSTLFVSRDCYSDLAQGALPSIPMLLIVIMCVWSPDPFYPQLDVLLQLLQGNE